MKTILTTSLFLLISFLNLAQCPPNPEIILESQQEIDDFIIQYPNCTEISGSLRIDGSGITNLLGLSNLVKINEFRVYGTAMTSITGLENLEEVTEYFYFTNNELLQNLIGFESLAFVGGFTIGSNDNLESLVGLENLVEVGTYNMHIIANSDLLNLDGLENLTVVNSQLFISNNDNLKNIDALTSVTQVKDLTIGENDNLSSITGLSNLDPNSTLHLKIFYNESLSYCAIWAVCENLHNPNIDFGIYWNAPGCNSPEEVEQDCNLEVEAYDESVISIYPNPVSNFLYINTSNQDFHEAKITSYLGELILVSAEKQIDLSILSSGIYFVNVETNKGNKIARIIKE